MDNTLMHVPHQAARDASPIRPRPIIPICMVTSPNLAEGSVAELRRKLRSASS